MAKQLIFCSVPHGLQPGRSGYCLVAGHTDLPQSLIRQLEQETSVFPVGKGPLEPLHSTRKLGETEWHLFIRQTIDIKDYTGRSSGLTHIIAERADRLPLTMEPQVILRTIKDWITTIPASPKVFGTDDEIQLAVLAPAHPEMMIKPTPVSPAYPPDHFQVNIQARGKRRTPMPRSGIYYERKRKRSRLGWWILSGAAVVIILVFVAF